MKFVLLAATMFGFVMVHQMSLAAESTQSAREYVSAQGTIKLDKLGNVISKFASNAKVEVTLIRWTRNPVAYAALGLSQLPKL